VKFGLYKWRAAGSRAVRQLLPAIHQLSQEQDTCRPGRRGARHGRSSDDDDDGRRVVVVVVVIVPACRRRRRAAAAHDVTRRRHAPADVSAAPAPRHDVIAAQRQRAPAAVVRRLRPLSRCGTFTSVHART